MMIITLTYKFYLPSYGGIEVLMHCIAREMVRRGVGVSIVTLRSRNLPCHEVIDGIGVYRFGFRWMLFSQVDVSVDISHLKGVLKDADVIHVFSSIPSHLLVSSLRLCRDLGRVCVWQPIYIPSRFRYHRSVFVRFLGSVWDRLFLPRLARYVHGLVALTSAEAGFFREGCRGCRFVVDVLGECVEEVPVDKGFVRGVLDRYGLVEGGYVLSVGRLAWYKGYDLLLDAWRFVEPRYPWLKLVIVGSDWGYKRAVLERIHRYGLRNVVLLEGLPSEELHALYEGSLFVAQLSRFETFHRVALEAWSHRKPIVALDLGPATEHIASDRGILVRDDVGEVVKAFEALINDDDLRRRMGLRGYEVFRERYSVERYVDRLLELYRKAEEVARG